MNIKMQLIYKAIKKTIISMLQVYIPDHNLSHEVNRDKAFRKFYISYWSGLLLFFFSGLAIFFSILTIYNVFLKIILCIVFSCLFLFGINLLIVGLKNNKIYEKYRDEVSLYSAKGRVFHYSGLPTFIENQKVEFFLNSKQNSLIFKDLLSKNPTQITLPLDKICGTRLIAATEVVKQSKQSNAILGGFLFGTAGAVVGALTAEENIQAITLYVINYVSNGEKNAIVLRHEGLDIRKLTNIIDSFLPDTNREIIL